MWCFMPLILVLRQEDKNYGASLRKPVLIPLSLGRKKGEREGKREPPGEGSASGEGLVYTEHLVPP